MPRDPEKSLARIAPWWFCRPIVRARAFNRRFREVWRDGLPLSQFHNRLRTEWRARNVHPWDRGLPRSEVTKLFAKQCLDDTSAVIESLLRELPEAALVDFK